MSDSKNSSEKKKISNHYSKPRRYTHQSDGVFVDTVQLIRQKWAELERKTRPPSPKPARTWGRMAGEYNAPAFLYVHYMPPKSKAPKSIASLAMKSRLTQYQGKD